MVLSSESVWIHPAKELSLEKKRPEIQATARRLCSQVIELSCVGFYLLLFTSLQTILPFLPPSAYFTSAREQTLHLLEPTNLPLFICTTLAVVGESVGAGTGFGAEAHFSSHFLLSLASLDTLPSLRSLALGLWPGGLVASQSSRIAPEHSRFRATSGDEFCFSPFPVLALRWFTDNEDDLVLTLWQISEGAVGVCFGFSSLEAERAACLVPG